MNVHPGRTVLFFVLAFVALSVESAERAPGKAAIASAHPLASQAGMEVLAKGGNAFDAAVAVSAALNVVEPNASGLGAGGFFLLHRASDGRNVMIDAREKAPGESTRDMFLDAQGKPVPGLSTQTALAAGIPGEPAGLAMLVEKYGKLPLKTSLQPAIRLAREGFPLYERLQGGIRGKQRVLAATSETKRLFLQNGEVPPLGYVIKQPELAKTYEMLAEKGIGAFYSGPFAKKLVAGVRGMKGIWSEKDLADYRVVEREVVVGDYRGARIVSASPPASGGIAIIDALNIIEGFDYDALDPLTRIHLVVESMRRAQRDRALYLGDPDFVQMPVERLTSQFYADGQRTSLSLERATPSAMLPSEAIEASQGTHTTHFSVLDRDGNRVGATITLNLWFGSGLTIPGTGILLNNQMDDFSIKPGTPNAYRLIGADANAIAPGKRPLSSSAPIFVEAPRGLMIAGTPGGSTIISTVLLATLDFMSGKSAQQIVSAPRFHHQYFPDQISFEAGAFDEATRKALTDRGHALREAQRWGNLQVITWEYDGNKVETAADPRGNGQGFVY
jgi:gamma-glutamyltranspeptidase / glutathione hydrolase